MDEQKPLGPASVVAWELEHGIVRYERDGMIYVSCVDWPRFMEQTAREKKERRRRAINAMVAEQQAKEMFGG